MSAGLKTMPQSKINTAASEAILVSFPDALAIVDSAGLIQDANERGAATLGYDRDALPVALSDVFSISEEDANNAIRDWLGSGDPLPRTFQKLVTDGEASTFRVEGWRFDCGGHAAIALRFFDHGPSVEKFVQLTELIDDLNRECSNRARIESDLRKLLGQLNATKNMRDLVIAQMSHDLRTPLNAIVGFSEFILTQPYGPVGDRYAQYIGDIKFSGESLLDMVNSIMAMTDEASIGSQTVSLLVDLSECIESCRRLVAPVAGMRGVEIVVPADMRLPRIRAERTLIKQILMNLIGNAVKHIGGGERVEVQVDWQEGSDLTVKVTDDGPGIEPKRLRRILRSGARTAYSTEDATSGLGLFLTKRSAELIGGELRIDSEPGRGTVARFSVPASIVVGASA